MLKRLVFLAVVLFLGTTAALAQVELQGITGFMHAELLPYLPAKPGDKALPLPQHLVDKYHLRRTETGPVLDALIQVAPGTQPAALEVHRISVLRHKGTVWRVVVPVQSLPALLATPGIMALEANTPVYPLLDSSKKYVHVNEVHAGTGGLPQAYKGQGVIAGMVDQGIDFTHPAFRTADGGASRLLRVWAQQHTTGTKPSGFDYGAEYTTPTDIENAHTDDSAGWHGTHVGGIMAGSGYGMNGRYIGMAPEADLVFVGSPFTNSGISDGIAYIFDYADVVGKPAVVNLSIGGYVGPRDGSSLFDKFVEQEVGPGKIVVGAAGNEGASDGHVRKELTNTTDTLRLLPKLGQTSGDSSWHAFVYNYSEANTNFRHSWEVYDMTGKRVKTMPFTPTGIALGYRKDTVVVVPGQDTVFIERDNSIGWTFSQNDRSYTGYYVRCTDPTRFAPALAITRTAASPHVHHAWAVLGGLTTFVDTIAGVQHPRFTRGDSLYTITEVGGTGKKTLSVTSYTNNFRYTNLKGQDTTILTLPSVRHGISPISSVGPTVDQRLKPDVAAPGNGIFAPYSRFTTPRDSFLVMETQTIGADTWYYANASGTSMASPHVAGIVVLLLQANPNLPMERIRDILQETAYTDDFTGSVPNVVWGMGKVNALQALLTTIATVGTTSPSNGQRVLASVYPNPGQRSTLQLQGLVGTATLRIIAADGRVLHTSQLGAGFHTLPQLATGVYTLQLQAPGLQRSLRWCVMD